MSQQTFIEQMLSAWQLLEDEKPDPSITSTLWRLPDGSKAVIEIQTPSCLALVELWEHADCLDTTIHREGEQTGVILSGGSCANRSEGVERLQSLRAALTQSNERGQDHHANKFDH